MSATIEQAKHLYKGDVIQAPAPVAPVYKSILDIPNPAKPKKVKAPKPAPAPVPAAVPDDTPTWIGGHAATSAQVPGVPLLGTAGTVYPVIVPAELADKIKKPVTGMGGWQRLMMELSALTIYGPGPDPSTGIIAWTITLTPHMMDRLITKAVKHGSGGYQAVIRWIVCLALSQHKAKILGGQ